MFETKFSTTDENFFTEFSTTDKKFFTEFGSFISSGQNFPYYKGEYTLTPSRKTQELQTANYILKEDVTVVAIPYNQVSNTVGGITFYIAKG